MCWCDPINAVKPVLFRPWSVVKNERTPNRPFCFLTMGASKEPNNTGLCAMATKSLFDKIRSRDRLGHHSLARARLPDVLAVSGRPRRRPELGRSKRSPGCGPGGDRKRTQMGSSEQAEGSGGLAVEGPLAPWLDRRSGPLHDVVAHAGHRRLSITQPE